MTAAQIDPADPIAPVAGVLTIPVPRRFTEDTVPMLEGRLRWEGAIEAVFDFSECRFLSSAGVRSVLNAHHRLVATG